MEDNISFAIGTGRCGTHFINKAISMESDISSVHERNPLNETFHRYCKWYGLSVDNEGFLHTKEEEIKEDLKTYKYSFEASAHLSLSVLELYSRFKAKFILLVRSPEKVVNSYLRKGTDKGVIKWYESPYVKKDLNSALGYQETTQFHHFLGRISPLGKEFKNWNKMTRVGKLAWYWSNLNETILKQFEQIPKDKGKIIKLEDLDYPKYLELVEYLGFTSSVSKSKYDDLVASKPSAQRNLPTVSDWTKTEKLEFEKQIHKTAIKLGYKWKF